MQQCPAFKEAERQAVSKQSTQARPRPVSAPDHSNNGFQSAQTAGASARLALDEQQMQPDAAESLQHQPSIASHAAHMPITESRKEDAALLSCDRAEVSSMNQAADVDAVVQLQQSPQDAHCSNAVANRLVAIHVRSELTESHFEM